MFMGLYLLPSHLQSNAGHTVTPNHDTQVSTHKSPHVYCHLERVISSSPQQFSVLQPPSYGRPWGPSLLLQTSCNQSITRAVQGRDGSRYIETLLTCKAGAPIQLSHGRYWQQQLTATKAPTRCGHISTTPNAATFTVNVHCSGCKYNKQKYECKWRYPRCSIQPWWGVLYFQSSTRCHSSRLKVVPIAPSSDQDTAGRSGVRSPTEEVFVSSPNSPAPPCVQWATRSFPGVKRSGRDVEHSRLCSDERVELDLQI